MVNLIKLYGDRVELPYLKLQYPLSPPIARMAEALEAYDALRTDLTLQALPLAERRAVTRFLRQFGQLLFNTLFRGEAFERLSPRGPLLLELGMEWTPYPWELLNNGERWIGLHQGIVRHLFAPETDPLAGRERARPLRAIAVAAQPLPGERLGELARQRALLGTRFISTVAESLPAATPDTPWQYASLEHASLADLEAAFAVRPEVLLFSGFAYEAGWLMEGRKLTPELARREWLAARMREATAEGLELLVCKDALGLNQPLTGAGQARDWLRAGLPGVVRIEGLLARLREQDYFRTVLQRLAQGDSIHKGHLAAVRRLHRRFEEAWDWSFMRLYLRGLPPTEPSGEIHIPLLRRSALGGNQSPDLFGALPAVATQPRPPAFAGRRRFFGREAELLHLAEALRPDSPRVSPLVFLSGPAGSGKTHLALELARRLRAGFSWVCYLHARDILPEPSEALPVRGMARNGVPAQRPLFAALARQLGSPALVLGGPEGWPAALKRHCNDGIARLIILDQLERCPGYEQMCEALQGLKAPGRVLILSRGKPPLLSGHFTELIPLSAESLRDLFGAEFVERLEGYGDGGRLLEHCGADLFAARLLRHQLQWPTPAELKALWREPPLDASLASLAPGARLLRLLLGNLLKMLDGAARQVLGVLSLFPSHVHCDLLAAAVESEGLDAVLTELQWFGLIDAFDCEQYLCLHPRLHTLVAEQLLTRPFLDSVHERLVEGFAGYLQTLGPLPSVEEEPAGSLRVRGAWANGASASALRAGHRLAVERVNLSELVLVLADMESWPALRKLVNLALPLAGTPGMDDALALVRHGLLLLGQATGDSAAQGEALNALARSLLEQGHSAEAENMAERALETLNGAVEQSAKVETYLLLAQCRRQAKQTTEALRLLHSAAELAQQTGQADGLVRACAALVQVWGMDMANHPAAAEAEPMLRGKWQYLLQLNDTLRAVQLERLLGDVQVLSGQSLAAVETYERVVAQFRQLDRPKDVASTQLRQADCLLRSGEVEQALNLLQKPELSEGAPHGELALERSVWEEMCLHYERTAQPEQALLGYQRLRRLLQTQGAREELIEVLDRLGGLYYQLGEQEESTRCYEEQLQLQASPLAG